MNVLVIKLIIMYCFVYMELCVLMPFLCDVGTFAGNY